MFSLNSVKKYEETGNLLNSNSKHPEIVLTTPVYCCLNDHSHNHSADTWLLMLQIKQAGHYSLLLHGQWLISASLHSNLWFWLIGAWLWKQIQIKAFFSPLRVHLCTQSNGAHVIIWKCVAGPWLLLTFSAYTFLLSRSVVMATVNQLDRRGHNRH